VRIIERVPLIKAQRDAMSAGAVVAVLLAVALCPGLEHGVEIRDAARGATVAE
jgi:hypothetical protein